MSEPNEKAMRVLESLTPGGSEYYNCPEACEAYIRNVRDSQHSAILKFVKEAKALKVRWNTLKGWLNHDKECGQGHKVGRALRLIEELEAEDQQPKETP